MDQCQLPSVLCVRIWWSWAEPELAWPTGGWKLHFWLTDTCRRNESDGTMTWAISHWAIGFCGNSFFFWLYDDLYLVFICTCVCTSRIRGKRCGIYLIQVIDDTSYLWSLLYENSYQLQNILKNFEFFVVCVDHKDQYNGRWKSPVSIKLAIITTPSSNLVNATLIIAINHWISRFSQKFKMN
jgi:hypothetical protein